MDFLSALPAVKEILLEVVANSEEGAARSVCRSVNAIRAGDTASECTLEKQTMSETGREGG